MPLCYGSKSASLHGKATVTLESVACTCQRAEICNCNTLAQAKLPSMAFTDLRVAAKAAACAAFVGHDVAGYAWTATHCMSQLFELKLRCTGCLQFVAHYGLSAGQ